MKPASYILHGHESEPFNALLLHESILQACLSVHTPEGEAHSTAERVCKHVIDWLIPKTEVTSQDVRRKAASELSTYQPEAAYMYENSEMMV